MSVEPEYAWAALAINARPRPFINECVVRCTRAEVHARIGAVHSRDGETAMEGWRRAYKRGWRAVRVKITLAEADHAAQ